jgi:hypothetical protein
MQDQAEFDRLKIVHALEWARQTASPANRRTWELVLKRYNEQNPPAPKPVEWTAEMLGHAVGDLSQHLGHRITITQFKDYFTNAITDYAIECLEDICEGGDVRIGEPEIILTFDEQLAQRENALAEFKAKHGL